MQLPRRVIMRFGHIAVLTKNMDASIDFYKKLGGTAASEEILHLENGETEHIVLMEFDENSVVELINPSYKSVEANPTAPIEHICFQVDDVKAFVKELRSKGIDTFTEDEPHHEQLFGPGGILVIFLTGPSGESIELLQKM